MGFATEKSTFNTLGRIQMDNPTVSIIIPAYNCGDYIEAAVSSCLKQDYDNIEVIVVNDGSTDNTRIVISKFESDSRVRLFNRTNQGVSAARNFGIEQARGEYITFLDADDEFELNTISPNIKLLISCNDADWLCFPIQRIDKDGNYVDEISPYLLPSFKYPEFKRVNYADAFSQMSLRQLPTCVCGSFFRRGFIDLRFKSGRFEDTIMVMELLRKRPKVILSPYGGYLYYDRSESFINSEWDADKWVSYVNVLWATMQTKLELFPSKTKEVEREKTKLYYNLRYLKAKNSGNQRFELPLIHFRNMVGDVKPSIIAWSEFMLKTVIFRCLKSVMR